VINLVLIVVQGRRVKQEDEEEKRWQGKSKTGAFLLPLLF